jgi:hypothetical protein
VSYIVGTLTPRTIGPPLAPYPPLRCLDGV